MNRKQHIMNWAASNGKCELYRKKNKAQAYENVLNFMRPRGIVCCNLKIDHLSWTWWIWSSSPELGCTVSPYPPLWAFELLSCWFSLCWGELYNPFWWHPVIRLVNRNFCVQWLESPKNLKKSYNTYRWQNFDWSHKQIFNWAHWDLSINASKAAVVAKQLAGLVMQWGLELDP